MPPYTHKLNKLLTIAENKQQQTTLQQLHQIAKQTRIPLTIIGGIAVAHYGYPRFTDDIDTLLHKKDTQVLTQALQKAGYTYLGSNTCINQQGIKINLCPEGATAGTTTFPPPETNTPGVTIASLTLLITLKIKANRYRDRADIVELIKRNNIDQDYLQTIPLNQQDQKRLLTLWRTAKKEQP